jgi:SAM-dependent methyltransferase
MSRATGSRALCGTPVAWPQLNCEAIVNKGSLEFPFPTPARVAQAEMVARALRRGEAVTDHDFDEIYPAPIREASAVHWTPVRVAARIVELLALRDGERLLDVGAGAGKFCIVAAAITGARVHGIERRPELVVVAQEAARRMSVDLEIAEASLEPDLAPSFDAAYFFNPFVLPLLLPGISIYAADRYAGRAAVDVAAAEAFFSRARPNMRIATFCGFGGVVPPSYERRVHEPWDGGLLELWCKVV